MSVNTLKNKEKLIKHIIHYLETFSDDSDEEQIKAIR